jgi:hypothetical protein
VPLTLQVIFDQRGHLLRERWLRVGDYLGDDTENGAAEVPAGTP